MRLAKKTNLAYHGRLPPVRLIELLSDKDKEKANRVMQAMMKMIKLDIAALEKAAEG